MQEGTGGVVYASCAAEHAWAPGDYYTLRGDRVLSTSDGGDEALDCGQQGRRYLELSVVHLCLTGVTQALSRNTAAPNLAQLLIRGLKAVVLLNRASDEGFAPARPF